MSLAHQTEPSHTANTHLGDADANYTHNLRCLFFSTDLTPVSVCRNLTIQNVCMLAVEMGRCYLADTPPLADGAQARGLRYSDYS